MGESFLENAMRGSDRAFHGPCCDPGVEGKSIVELIHEKQKEIADQFAEHVYGGWPMPEEESQ